MGQESTISSLEFLILIDIADLESFEAALAIAQTAYDDQLAIVNDARAIIAANKALKADLEAQYAEKEATIASVEAQLESCEPIDEE